MSSQPPFQQPEHPAILPTVPASNVSRRAAFRGVGGLSAAFLLAAAPRFAGAHSEDTNTQSEASDTPTSVVGAWDLIFRRHDAAAASGPDRALATFGAEGGFQAALAPAWLDPSGAARFHAGGHGSWTTNDDGLVEVRYTTLVYDETGACDGARQVSLTIGLYSGIYLSGAYESLLYDADGNLVDFVSGKVAGIVAENLASGSRGYPSLTSPDWDVSPPEPSRLGETF